MLHHQPKCPSDAPLRVVPISEAFDQIKKAHAQLGHAGYVKTFNNIKEWFFGITKEQVQWLVGRCQTCLKNHPNRSRGELDPIISNHILQRVQIDLIDMRHEPNGQYKWILHIIDHFSKFSSVVALKSKQAVEVADAIAEWIGHFEPPEILQCDNGREFKGVLLILLKKYGVKVINGRPRTPSTPGLVEQANGTVKTHLRAWKEDTRSKAWAIALPDIMLKMNCAVHGATGKSPYEVMFGQKSCWNEHLSPVEGTAVNIDHISDEVTTEPSIEPAEVDDIELHNFTEHYTFDLDEDLASIPADTIPALVVPVIVPVTATIPTSITYTIFPGTEKPSQQEPLPSSQASTTSTLSSIPETILSGADADDLTPIEKEVQAAMAKSQRKMVEKFNKRFSP